MRRWVIAITALGCGNDEVRNSVDGPPAGTPIVAVTSPRANEAFYASENLVVVWTATDDDSLLDCTVTAFDGASSFPIADKLVASGFTSVTLWTLATVPLSNSYRISVSCVDDTGVTGVGMSGVFAVTGPPQAVSYSTQIQPLWDATCATMPCHDATQPQEELDLTASVSHANIVGVASTQCPSTQLVNPGNPGASYLLFKLQGSGPCMKGGRMPKTSPGYTPAQLQLVRDWIANGALAN